MTAYSGASKIAAGQLAEKAIGSVAASAVTSNFGKTAVMTGAIAAATSNSKAANYALAHAPQIAKAAGRSVAITNLVFLIKDLYDLYKELESSHEHEQLLESMRNDLAQANRDLAQKLYDTNQADLGLSNEGVATGQQEEIEKQQKVDDNSSDKSNDSTSSTHNQKEFDPSERDPTDKSDTKGSSGGAGDDSDDADDIFPRGVNT